MENFKIRKLNADEIEVRIGQVSTALAAANFLLYKNARVDMAILDELVGPMNWQRDHKELKGNLYAGVGIWNNNAGCWVWKWDCGTESNTEKEKGEASDSFKRACVNWGIGRELYTAPQIWVKYTTKEYNNGKPRISLNVQSIAYTDDGVIKDLVIIDRNLNVRFYMENGRRVKSKEASVAQVTASEK